MQIKEFLNTVCEQIKYKPIRREISDEMKNHIEELKENYILDGMNEQEAEKKAIKQMGDAEQIGKKLNKIHKPRFDWKLVLIVLVLLFFGFLVCSIRINNLRQLEIGEKTINKFVFFIISGFILSIFIYFYNYKKILKFSNIIYIIATLTIIYALLFGIYINGRAVIYVKLFSISPMVLAVPLYIVSFIGFIENMDKETKFDIKIKDKIIKINFIKLILLGTLSLILLLQIPSSTSVLILTITYLVLLTLKFINRKSNRVRNLICLWGIPIILLVLFLIYNGVFTRVIDRFQVALHPEIDPYSSGWLGMNQNLIIDSAQLFGEARNLGNSMEIFDEGTNFALISILAHYGWILTIFMVVVIMLLCIKLIYNSIKIKDNYGRLLVIGISSMFILQSIFNILMNMNLWISADFNIPFVSYGGMNLVVNMMCLSFILSIYRRKNILEKKDYINNETDIKEFEY